MKLYMTHAPVSEGYSAEILTLWQERPVWFDGQFCGHKFETWTISRLRSLGFIRNFPKGKQVLVVNLSLK